MRYQRFHKSFHNSCLESHLKFQHIHVRVYTSFSMRTFTPRRVLIFCSRSSETRTRNRYASSIIVRFFARLSRYIQEQEEEVARGCTRASVARECEPRLAGAVTPGNRMRYHAFATRERYVLRAYSGVRVARVACLRRFFPTQASQSR